MSMEGSGWGEDKNHPRDEWKQDVANGDTQLGYWDWVEHNKESEALDAKMLAAHEDYLNERPDISHDSTCAYRHGGECTCNKDAR